MSPTPPTASSSSTGAYSPNGESKVVRKRRNRVPLSCSSCRHRKLKCNRSHPCENCVRRGDRTSCTYAISGQHKRRLALETTSPDGMQHRIDRLEGLVLSLMTNGAQSAGPAAANAALSDSQNGDTSSSIMQQDENVDRSMIKAQDENADSEVEEVADSLGMLRVDPDRKKAMYFGDTHWHLVLADQSCSSIVRFEADIDTRPAHGVSTKNNNLFILVGSISQSRYILPRNRSRHSKVLEVKTYFANHKKEFEKQHQKVINQSKPNCAADESVFLLRPHEQATDLEIRSELPPKPTVDRLVTRFFNSYQSAQQLIHPSTFHKHLFDHWQDPSNIRMEWVGLLYSVLCLAMRSYKQVGDEPLEWKGRTSEMANNYRQKTVQCLVNLDYTKSSYGTIETLCLYFDSECGSRFDVDVALWVVVGMITRLAMRMGYHRDPSRLTGLSTFQAEMRRRTWAYVRHLDTVYSFNLALPGMIKATDCDTKLPSSLFEDEFDPDTKVLPPSRPTTEPTPVSYLILMSKISLEVQSIIDMVGAINMKPTGYDDVINHDNNLREIRDTMPNHLKLRHLDECTHDPPTLLMQRSIIDILWQKAMCVLHRKFLVRARHNPRYAHSRRACIDSAMELLHHHKTLHYESQPGGRMGVMKWYISSISISDYLLGATIVCLDLHYDSMARSSPQKFASYNPYFWNRQQCASMINALETSLAIWRQSAETSVGAFKASSVLGVMLDALKRAKESRPPVQPPLAQTPPDSCSRFNEANLRPEESAAMTLGLLSGSLSPSTNAMYNIFGANEFGTNDLNMSDTSAGIPSDFLVAPSSPFGTMPLSLFNNQAGSASQLDAPTNLDWEAWDAYIQNGGNFDSKFNHLSANMDQLSPMITEGPQTTEPGVHNSGVFMGAPNSISGN